MNSKRINLRENKNKIIFIFLTLLIILGAVFTYLDNSKKKVIQMHASFINVPETIEEHVGSLKNAFTGVVIDTEKQVYNIKKQPLYTMYKVRVVDNIKGDIEGEVVVHQKGGDFKEAYVKFAENEVIRVGSLYLFEVKKSDNHQWYSQVVYSGTLTAISRKPGNKKENIELSRKNKRYIEVLKAYINEEVSDYSLKLGVSGNFFKDLPEGKKKELKERLEKLEKNFNEKEYLEREKENKELDIYKDKETFSMKKWKEVEKVKEEFKKKMEKVRKESDEELK